jgi:hypothetical protein
MELAVGQSLEYRRAWKLLLHSLFQTSRITVIIHEYSRAPRTDVCVTQIARAVRSWATCGTVSHRLASPLNRLLRSTRHAATASCTTTSRSAFDSHAAPQCDVGVTHRRSEHPREPGPNLAAHRAMPAQCR